MKVRAVKGDMSVGLPLTCNFYDRNRRLLLRQGAVIYNQRQIDTLVERGTYFFTNDEAMDAVSRPATAPPVADRILDNTVGGSIPVNSPFELIDHVHLHLGNVYGALELKNLPARILRLCRVVQCACMMDKNAALGSILWHGETRYSVGHQIHTAIVCEVVLNALGYSPAERLSVLAAALTMNVAMSALQDALFFQKEDLTDGQRAKIASHPTTAIDILQEAGVRDELWLNTVFNQHELLDGSGYPRGLKDLDVPVYSRLITIADIYCAKVTGRAYRKPLPPNRSLVDIFQQGHRKSLDFDLTQVLIKTLGIYPPGSFVRLMNGEIGVVVQCGDRADHQVVRSVLKTSGDTFLNPVLRDCREKQYAIVEAIDPGNMRTGINRYHLWKPTDASR